MRRERVTLLNQRRVWIGAVRVGAVLVGAVWVGAVLGAVMALGPEKVLKMNTYRATSKSIFAQLCRQLRFPDDGVGGWILTRGLCRGERSSVFCLLSSVFCLKKTPPPGEINTPNAETCIVII